MGEGSRARWVGSVLGALGLLGAATGASAFDFLDGRVQVHGFYESQIRTLVRDYDQNDGWDLSQWYHVLNIEVDWEIAPDGIGPLDLVSAFGRVEARYDCVWTKSCGMFPSVNTYGSRSRNGGRLPKRLRDGQRNGFEFAVFNGDTAEYHARDQFTALNQYDNSGLLGIGVRSPRGVPVKLDSVPGFSTLMGSAGPDTVLGTADDPGSFYFSSLFPGCRFGVRDIDGTVNGVGTQSLVHTVNKSDCKIRPNATMAGKPNPFNPNDLDSRPPDPMDGTPPPPGGFQRQVLPNGGAFALPLRPAPLYAAEDPGNPSAFVPAPRNQAQGVFYPNASLFGEIDDYGHTDQNFRQSELAWNRGASQDEKELKELFVEFEMFDSRLWIRAGKQQIVWGKTELFRTTDQFNPQDLALGSLTSLEESRIALWSARGVWSFYEVGPLEDVRLELALNYDDIEPADLGRCGEPYTPLPACDLSFGMLAHGMAGIAIAGYDRPDDPWDDISGIEVGARLEWRLGRFSMALIDFYGYDDSFWVDQTFAYSRNVDPVTGIPRHTMARGDCTVPLGAPGTSPPGTPEASCLRGVAPGTAFPAVVPVGVTPGAGQLQLGANNSLQFHSVNQQLFAMICATSLGFSDLDRASCAQSVFNSQNQTGTPAVTIATAVSSLLAGDATGLVFGGLLGVAIPGGPCDPGDVASGTLCNPLIQLSNDVSAVDGMDYDGAPLTQPEALAAGLTPTVIDGAVLYRAGLQGVLTDEQQALLGCGPFYGTYCDGHGIDLLNAEASALLQSLYGYDGTPPVLTVGSSTGATDPSFVQPGTVGFRGGPICTRFEGRRFILPGCRGLVEVVGAVDTLDQILFPTLVPNPDPDVFDEIDGTVVYDPRVDGTTSGAGAIGGPFERRQPFTGQFFKSEMATLSWNAVMSLVALSTPPDFVDRNGDGFIDRTPGSPDDTDGNGDGWPDSPFIAQDEFDILRPFRSDGCSIDQPGLCSNVRAIGSVTGVGRAIVRAGGNGEFGRRDFVWAGGSELALRFNKRNVLGFSMDFAEDVTKTNWGMEFTWIPNLPTSDNAEFDGISETDQFNLTIAVDRPTFINFLNQNRTFFITTQWFMRYTKDYQHSMPGEGPWSTLAILNVSSGYFQDRLLPGVTFVYDFRSNSGAVLPSVGYRFTENFSATFGFAIFSGRTEEREAAITPTSLGNRVGKGAYSAHVDRGLSLIRERDEVFLRVRYTF